ncbi:hypothetical protein GCM10023192_68800 [Amycolatopsis samaneae]
MVSSSQRRIVEADTALARDKSSSRWSWRSIASTSTACSAADTLRHRDPITRRRRLINPVNIAIVAADTGNALR